MDGTKRKAKSPLSVPLIPLTGPVYMGESPPLGIPSMLQRESAVRFTPLPCKPPKEDKFQNIHPALGLVDEAPPPSAVPRSLDPDTQASVSKNDGIDEDYDLHVDTEDGNDGVYMLNADGGSWSGTLPSEDDPSVRAKLHQEAKLVIANLRRSQGLATQEQQDRLPEIAEQAAEQTAKLDQQKWQKDLLIRNIIRQVKTKLRGGELLTLERTGRNRSGLWNGKGIIGDLPDAQVVLNRETQDAPVSIPNLDGNMDEIEFVTVTRPVKSNTPRSVRHTIPTLPRASSACTASTAATQHGDAAEPESPSVARSQRRISRPEQSPTRHGRTDDCQVVRRSTRLHSNAAKSHLITPNATPRSSRKDSNGKDLPMIMKMSADDIGKEAAKAETRLKTMYAQRERALATLTPGTTNYIRNTRGLQSGAKCYAVSMDALGVVHSDLLAEPGMHQPVLPTGRKTVAEDELSGALQGSMLDNPRHADHQKGDEQVDERWCYCRGVDDGRLMIECSNNACLIGWYHFSCVDINQGLEEEWTCKLCEPANPSDRGAMPPNVFNEEFVNDLYAPPYARRVNTRYMKTPEPPLYLGSQSDRDESTTESSRHIPQFDGTGDVPPSLDDESFLYTSNNDISRIPQSLLSSKHAPQPQELAFREGLLRTKSPALFEFPDTPGSPHPSTVSTTSTGEWRRPPTRFQHLANFIRGGDSLNYQEKAAVKLWKMASQEQIVWNAHRERYAKTMTELTAALRDDVECMSVDAQQTARGHDEAGEEHETADDGMYEMRHWSNICSEEEHGETEESQQDLEAKAGYWKKKCRGRDLSTVLREI